MLKTLIKKQLRELLYLYLKKFRTNSKRSAMSVIGLILLFVFCFGMIGWSVSMICGALALGSLENGTDWLYFSVTGLIALGFSVIGGAFMSYAMLFQAKDNETLLALPIPPGLILISRMTAILIFGTVFELSIMVPAMIVYWKTVPVSAITVLCPILLTVCIALLSLAASCAVGFVIAKIAARIRSKLALSLIAVALMGGLYYFCYFRMNEMMEKASENTDKLAEGVKKYLFLFYEMGQGGAGQISSLVVFAGITAAAVGLVYLLLSLNFTKLVTGNRGTKKTAYSAGLIRSDSRPKALLKREFRHLLSSPAYMLNCGLGLIIMPVAAVGLLLKHNDLSAALAMLPPDSGYSARLLPAFLFAAIGFITSMDCFTAPSVSLEGKNLWILRAMPVSTKEILTAKLKMHIALNSVPGALLLITASAVFGFRAAEIAALVPAAASFLTFSACLGLTMGLKFPMLDWSSETAVVKQSLSVLFTILILLVTMIGVIAGIFYIAVKIGTVPYLLALTALFGAAALLIGRWIMGKGARIFEEL